VIYYGNAKRDEEGFEPRTYVIPSQTCKAFYDVSFPPSDYFLESNIPDLIQPSPFRTTRHNGRESFVNLFTFSPPAMQLEVYEDKSITTKRLLNETEVSGGKTAVNGCPDFDAAAEVLKKAREEGVQGVREGGHIQGKYGTHPPLRVLLLGILFLAALLTLFF
jgi:hypothetical protein